MESCPIWFHDIQTNRHHSYTYIHTQTNINARYGEKDNDRNLYSTSSHTSGSQGKSSHLGAHADRDVIKERLRKLLLDRCYVLWNRHCLFVRNLLIYTSLILHVITVTQNWYKLLTNNSHVVHTYTHTHARCKHTHTHTQHTTHTHTHTFSMRFVRRRRTPQLMSKPTPPGDTIDSGSSMSNAAMLPAERGQ